MAEYTLVADKSGEVRMEPEEKLARYREIAEQLASVMEDEEDLLACMASVVCLLHNAFPGHIACDAGSLSEIVVPVFDAAGELTGVLDVDSSAPAAFDETDCEQLEAIVALLREKRSLPVVWTS